MSKRKNVSAPVIPKYGDNDEHDDKSSSNCSLESVMDRDVFIDVNISDEDEDEEIFGESIDNDIVATVQTLNDLVMYGFYSKKEIVTVEQLKRISLRKHEIPDI